MPAKHLCIIPARAGSKSIPHKNLLRLPTIYGSTITRWAIQKAMEAKIFHHIILTTDIPKTKINIDDLTGNSLSKFECISRPADLCKDDSLMIDVVKHAINYAGKTCEYVWLLQPTSPFRDTSDFLKIKTIIETGEYNSVISFKETKDHPNRTYTIKDEDMTFHPLRHTNFKNKQDLMPVWTRSGNFYVSKRELILENDTFENKPGFAYKVDRIKGINIDEEDDYEDAKKYLSKGTIKL